MADSVELVALQMVSEPDVENNLRTASELIHNWHKQRKQSIPALIVLPECFAFFGGVDKEQLDLITPQMQQRLETWCKTMALDYQIWLVTGSLPTPTNISDKFYATSWLINPQGEICAEYHKSHLFDVNVQDNTKRYHESATTLAGEKVRTYEANIGHIGMAICYDLRFSRLFDAMSAKKPLDIIVLPAAFTYTTGKAHWHTLLAARAIEYQCYVVAANQGGTHANGRQTYGHSVIFSPWGEQLCQIESGQGWISTHTQPDEQNHIRQAIPMAQHRKEF